MFKRRAAVAALGLVVVLWWRRSGHEPMPLADHAVAAAVLRDLALTDDRGLDWAFPAAAGWVIDKQASAASFGIDGAGDRADIGTASWQLHIQLDRIATIVCTMMPGMGAQATRLSQDVVFRDATGATLFKAHFGRDHHQEFDELCERHHLPRELDGFPDGAALQ